MASTRRSSLLLLLLSGCAAPLGLTDAPPAPAVAIVPDDGGFAVPQTGLRIDWGRSEPGAVAALTKGFGPPLAVDGCGALRAYGFAAVTAYFREGALRGWQTDAGQAGEVCPDPR